MMSHKVAFIATVYRHLEAFHLPFINLLQKKGCEVHAYAAPDHGKEGVRQQNVICHDIPFQRSPFHLGNVKAFKRLYQSFKEEQFDLIHVHTPVAGILGRLAAKMVGIPCVIYTAHGFHFFQGAPLLNWVLYYPAERLVARWTDYLITINDEDFKRAQRFPVRKKVMYVPGVGVDTNEFYFSNKEEVRRQKREELGISDNDFVILSVAELNENKNIAQLIDAMSYMKQKLVKCLVVGDGNSREKLEKKANELGLAETVYFLGFRRDVPELMAFSDVVTLLSKREGLPRALIEGLAAGKPIVTTNVRGNRDLVENGVNGYVVSLGDTQRTVKAFMELLNDRGLRTNMGKMSFEKVQQYDIANILKKMEELYEKALSTSSK